MAEISYEPKGAGPVTQIDEAKRQKLLELVRGRALARPTDLAEDEVMVWPSLVVIEAVSRLVPGVMGNDESGGEESFGDGLLEHPHYTRPATYRGWEVPAVLRSGDHGAVARWRRAMALARTAERRPDLIEARGGLSDAEVAALKAELGLHYGSPAPSDPDRSS